jgi:hypothetical protein
VPVRSDWRLGLAVFVGAFLLYQLTFAATPTGNGQWLLPLFARGDREKILLADWPLTGGLQFALTRLLAGPGAPFTPLGVVQTANALAAAGGIAAFCQTIVLLGGGARLGVLASALLATSFASWFSVNADTHHVALAATLGLFYLLVRRRAGGGPYGAGFVAALAALNGAAALLLRSAVLFGAGAAAAGFVGRPWRRAARDTALYVVVGAVTMAGLSLAVGMVLLGTRDPRALLHWYALNLRLVWEPHEAYEPTGLLVTPLKLIKGQLGALLYGTQALSDALREPALFARAKVAALIGLALAGYALLAALAVDVWRARARVVERSLLALALCGAWWLAGKVVLNWWFWPGAPKYHLQTVPPLLVLLLLGAIAGHLVAGEETRQRRRLRVVGALLVVVAVGNFWGAILPWYRYGQQRQALTALARSEFRDDDYFVTVELQPEILLGRPVEHLSVKDAFRTKSKPEGFDAARAAIAERVAAGRRVFACDLIPASYTLFGLNHMLGRRPGEQFTRADFEAFVAGLRERYVLTPVVTYWDEARAPMYLLGERSETIWRVTRRS